MINLCRRRAQDTGLVEERRGRLQGRVSGGRGTWLSFAKNRYCEDVQKAGVWVHALRSLSVSLKKETLTKTQANVLILPISLPSLFPTTHHKHTIGTLVVTKNYTNMYKVVFNVPEFFSLRAAPVRERF